MGLWHDSPTFDEDFTRFDHGMDQKRPLHPHRWRTVYGHGGELSVHNRQLSASSFASDAEFAGIRNGRPGIVPLGLDPFVHSPHELTILGQVTPSRARSSTWGKSYFGGVITSKFSFAQLFGYFEIEACLPCGKGMWPAFWLMPLEGRWPDCGEIDVFESLGDPREIHCTVIAGQERRSRRVALEFDASAGFHRYGALWTESTITWFVDRAEVFRAPTPRALQSGRAYLIANLAIGGSWGGMPDASTRFPGRYRIRRIRAWSTDSL